MQENFQYYIDVAGTCNLACPSCPVGMEKSKSVSGVSRPRGMMSLDLLARILDKIAAERPAETVLISYFNWGEPLLNKDLPEMIRLARGHGFRAGVSTNFNVDADLRAIAASEPTYFKISVSGYNQDVYGVTHRQGDVNMVIANLHRLRHYMDRLHVNFNVFINYHMYKHNIDHNIIKMKETAERLRFGFIPEVASMISPIDFYIFEKQITEDQKTIENLLLVSMEQRIATGKHLNQLNCGLRDTDMVINHDASVALCCATYDSSTRIAPSFFDAPHEELQRRKYASDICRVCMERGLHAAVTLRISPAYVNQVLEAQGAMIRLQT